jgi:F0F1-type ATP synthase assembly protein I
MGLEFVIAILVCLFAGRWLDGRLGTGPLFMIVGVFLGAGVSTFAMYRRVFPPDKPASPKSDGR